ncbi:MAG: hypothetical protein HQL31_03680 [Planctomycetes bacterium]|nr:hypothetical protein [Planctomycetota bacterium]
MVEVEEYAKSEPLREKVQSFERRLATPLSDSRREVLVRAMLEVNSRADVVEPAQVLSRLGH